jgi:hypothetical protein
MFETLPWNVFAILDGAAAMWIITGLLGIATACLIEEVYVLCWFGIVILSLLVFIPLWKYHLQFSKHVIPGPWDIPKL